MAEYGAMNTVWGIQTRPVAALLALFLAACGEPYRAPVSETPRIIEFQTTEVFAAGYGSITEKYFDRVDLDKIALEGMKGFGSIDPALTVSREGEFAVLMTGDDEAARLPAPASDNVQGWAELTTRFAEAARTRSSEMRTIDDERLYEAVFDGVLSNLDRFSHYAGVKEARKNRAKRDGFGGIGIKFKLDGDAVKITSVRPEMPAASAGLKENDRITHIDQISLKQLTIDEIVSRLRGPTQTIVRLTIERPGETTARQITIKRTHIVPKTVTASYDNGILLLVISGFNQDTTRSVASELVKAKENTGFRLRGLVLDLRNNPGGLLKQSVKVADLLLSQGHIVATKGRHPDSINHYEAGGRDLAGGVPVIVLIDGKSASAAEIVAAALQDRGRAVVVGTSSYGKGTVQTVIRLPNDGEITLTWSRLIPPSGYTLHGLGLHPTICTSGRSGAVDALVRSALTDRLAIQRTFEAWRTPGIQEESRRRDLRNTCPSQRLKTDLEVRLAKHLLADAALYSQAMDVATPADQARY